MKKFTPSHEWIQLEGNVGTVGITDYAQKELGEIVHIELPPLNKHLKAGEEACVLESTKAAADIYSPITGKVVAVNDALRAHPAAINRHAETSAWLFQIEAADPREYADLLSVSDYNNLIL